MGILNDLSLWLWRLIPANPILVRVVTGGGKRWQHFHARWIYLLLLFVFMSFSGRSGASLTERAKESTNTFYYVSMVQLGLMAFIAPVFAAAAITQEKDSNTFAILLTTPLSSAQIVFGSLLSRLYFVWVLLLSGLPVFCITMIYGGVTMREVVESFGLAACTGLVTGALAITISVLKVGTRRTIFSFFVGVAVYLLAVGAVGLRTNWGILAEAPINPEGGQMSWLAPIHPFLALLVVTGQTPAPPMDEVFKYGWPVRWLLAYPQYGYMWITSLVSIALVLSSLSFVRRGAREGEVTWLSNILDRLMPRSATDRRRKPRNVWNNPIAWREAATRASAGGRSTMRWFFVVAGLGAGCVLLYACANSLWGMRPKDAAPWLAALVMIELAVILLVVTSTAATALTREREAESLEILLCTPLTSSYIVWGLLRGMVWFSLPFIAVPTITTLLFMLATVSGGLPGGMVPFESALLLPIELVAIAGTCAIFGLNTSLSYKRTVQSIMISTVGVLLASAVLFGCGSFLLNTSPLIGAVFAPFSPFAGVQSIVDPQNAFDPNNTVGPGTIITARIWRSITVVAAGVVYSLLTYSLYVGMVKNFDMTVRRQSA